MRPKCLWTGTHSDRAIAIEVQGTDRLGRPGDIESLTVLPEHEAALRAYAERAQRYGSALLVGLLSLTAVSLVAAALGTLDVWSGSLTVWVIGACVALMGVMMVVVPLATPETVQAFGVCRSMQIARVSGVLTLAIGLAMAFLG